ncbi:hypothetical protein D3C73_1572810 [compost metagenome]
MLSFALLIMAPLSGFPVMASRVVPLKNVCCAETRKGDSTIVREKIYGKIELIFSTGLG